MKPCRNRSFMCSAAMPTPLSMTEMRTPRVERPIRSVISLSGRPDSSHAYLALRTRLTRICSTLCLSTVTGGTCPNSRFTCTPWRSKAPGIQSQAILDQGGDLDGFRDPAELGVALLHRHGVLDVLQIVAQQRELLQRLSVDPAQLRTEGRQVFAARAVRADPRPKKAGGATSVLRQEFRQARDARCARLPDPLRDQVRRDVDAVEDVADVVQHVGGDLGHAGGARPSTSSLCTRSIHLRRFLSVTSWITATAPSICPPARPAGERSTASSAAGLRCGADDQLQVADGLAAQRARRAAGPSAPIGVTPSESNTSAMWRRCVGSLRYNSTAARLQCASGLRCRKRGAPPAYR